MIRRTFLQTCSILPFFPSLTWAKLDDWEHRLLDKYSDEFVKLLDDVGIQTIRDLHVFEDFRLYRRRLVGWICLVDGINHMASRSVGMTSNLENCHL